MSDWKEPDDEKVKVQEFLDAVVKILPQEARMGVAMGIFMHKHAECIANDHEITMGKETICCSNEKEPFSYMHEEFIL